MKNKRQTNWKGRTILFLISQCITLFGSTLVQMAIVWYVTLNTSSGAWVAAFSVCSYLPQLLVSFLGGVWADRYNRKKLIIGADTAIAAVTLVMMLAMPYITEESLLLGSLLVMSVIRSIGAGIQTPAVNAVLPQLVPEDQLMRFNGMTISTLRSTLMIDVVTAILGVGLLSTVMIPKQERTEVPASVFADMKIGVRYAFSNHLIGSLLIVYGLFVFLCVPAGFLAGLLVSRVYGDTYWYLTAVELVGFAGMMVGGLLMSTWGGFQSRVKTLLVGLAAFGAMAIGMGLSKNFILYLALMALYGVALTTVQTATTTLIQENAETSMQGRMFGLLGSIYSGFMPIGMAIFGPLADGIQLQWIMIASGVALIGIAGGCAANRVFRKFL